MLPVYSLRGRVGDGRPTSHAWCLQVPTEGEEDIEIEYVSAPLEFESASEQPEDAMDEEVRVAADWRGEVRIEIECEAEVPDVPGRVHSLTHRA